MEISVREGKYDLIIHSAAVSDYKVDGTFEVLEGDEMGSISYPSLRRIPNNGKISSRHQELYLKMVPTPKIIELIRDPWGFKGKLVKFKLEVGITDEQLIAIVCKSREHSKADLIVANCLEWASERAYVIGADNVPESVTRGEIANAILRRVS